MVYITVFEKEDFSLSLYICEKFLVKNYEALIKNCKYYINHNSQFGISGRLNINKTFALRVNDNLNTIKHDSEKKLKDYYFNNLINICWSGDKWAFLFELFENYENDHINLIGWLLS